jgi:hypothetical protein
LEAGGRLEYKVKWKGFKDCTWEPVESFERGGMEALEDFIKKEKEKKEIQIPAKARFAIYLDNQIDKSQYETVED